MRAKVVAFAVMLAFIPHCGSRNAQNSRTYTLPSGKQIKVEGIKKINFAEYSSLEIDYETEIPVKNKEALHKEVAEVWSVFQTDAERVESKVGIIQATHYYLGGLVHEDKRYGFVLSKRDGQWHFVEEDWFTEGK
jgi:hypothetical protein